MNLLPPILGTIACMFLFYILLFPMKRLIGSAICAPLERLDYKYKFIPESPVESILIQFLNIFIIYIIVGFLTGMSLSGSVYLINSSIIGAKIELTLIRNFVIFGTLVGILIVSICRILAVTYSILGARLLVFYVLGILGLTALYTILDYTAFTKITDLALKRGYRDLPQFIFGMSLFIAFTTELSTSVLRKMWKPAKYIPYQMINEIRQSFEEHESAFGKQEIHDLIKTNFKSELNSHIEEIEISWITLDGPIEFAEIIRQEIEAHVKTKEGIDICKVYQNIRVITTEETAMEMNKILPANYLTVDEKSLGYCRFIIFNRDKAIIYFPIPIKRNRLANVAQLIDPPLRVHEINSHFDQWWRTLEKKSKKAK